MTPGRAKGAVEERCFQEMELGLGCRTSHRLLVRDSWKRTIVFNVETLCNQGMMDGGSSLH